MIVNTGIAPEIREILFPPENSSLFITKHVLLKNFSLLLLYFIFHQ